MSLPSKEINILELFFNEPSKHWHFEEILNKSKVSRSKTNKWLAKLVKKRIIRHIKSQGKMPYFQGFFDSPAYRSHKRLFAFSQLQKSGLLDHLISLPKAKAVIIFGSFIRADWYKESDIDIFIYGSDEGLDTLTYSGLLCREIQVFVAPNQLELERMGPGLLQNILEGMLIKGKIDFIQVMPLATV
ncbi:MAG: nucleotidyltransferase domain-containing protein [Candidatus Nanoarchaeia archaeon]|nr:nucleotidyltransferase domain-containing protein [Candidatus Nanoarchaeia archaeon]